MGFLASVCEPHIYGASCTRDEWREFLQRAILSSLQDEEEWGRHYAFVWAEFRRDFPQLTLREFVIACGEVATHPTLVAT
jgi:hypothetical protein